jgi:hypothetical protein
VLPGTGPILAAAMDGALAFDKQSRWQSARDMAGAIRAAYGEARRRPPPLPARRPGVGSDGGHRATPVEVVESPSMLVEVAFGDRHDEEIERERERTRKATEGITR